MAYETYTSYVRVFKVRVGHEFSDEVFSAKLGSPRAHFSALSDLL